MKDILEDYGEIVEERGNTPYSEEETISQRLVGHTLGVGDSSYPPWVAETEKPAKEPLTVTVNFSDNSLETELLESKASPKAQRVLELIAAGEKPGKAAKKMNTTVGELLQGSDFKSGLKALIEANYAPNEVRKEMVRAGFNKIFIQNIDGNSLKKQKMAIAAGKEIAKDPDVGLNAQPTGTFVSVDLGKLGELLSQKITLPGLDDLGEKKE